MDDLEITLYLVGANEEEARSNFPFDSYESAENYANDWDEILNIYSVSAKIDFSTIELEAD